VAAGPTRFRLERRDIKTVEVSAEGRYQIGPSPMTLDEIERALVNEYQRNPKLVVDIRADRRVSWEHVSALFDRCGKHGITRVRAITFPER
jgi:biopolymer transport protein ExbD